MQAFIESGSSLIRTLLAVAVLICWQGTAHAASDCAAVAATAQRKTAEPILDWYDNYIRPYRSAPDGTPAARLTTDQVEAFIGEIGPFHRRAVLDPLYFEPLVQRVAASYARSPGFKGFDTAAADKIYKSSLGPPLDFSLLCISARALRLPDDAFAITLFGVAADDCQHIGLRGLVFTAILVNGSASGQCRPDQMYAKMFFRQTPVGTNEITFVCGKDPIGCARE